MALQIARPTKTQTRSESYGFLTIDQWLGMFSLLDSSIIPDYYLANMVNCSCAGIGGIFPFPQYSPFANTLSGAGKITACYNTIKTKSSLNQYEIPIRLRDNGTTAILEWYNALNQTYEILYPGLTTGKTMSFIDYNLLTLPSTIKDGMYCGNGVDGYIFWSKAIGTVASNDATSITLNESNAVDQGFSASGGTVIINGTNYTYSGVSTNKLTGLTALPTLTVNQGIASVVTVDSNLQFNILWEVDGRVWGTNTGTSSLQWSKRGDGSDFTVGVNPDDGGVETVQCGPGGITGIFSLGAGGNQTNMFICGNDKVISLTISYPTSTTAIDYQVILKQGDSVGPTNQAGIVPIGDSIYFVTKHGGVKSVSLSKAYNGFEFDNITENIRPTIQNGDFSDCRASYDEKNRIFVVSFKSTSASTFNDTGLNIEITKDILGNVHNVLGIFDWSVGGWFHYQGNWYFGSSNEPNCFKALDGYTRNGAPYTALFTMKRYAFSGPLVQKKMRYIGITGYISDNTTLKFQVDFDYLGSLVHLDGELKGSDNQYIIKPVYNTIGAFTYGTEPIGGTLQGINELNYFKVYFEFPEDYNFYDIQLTGYSDDLGARWQVESVNLDIVDSYNEIPELLKKSFK